MTRKVIIVDDTKLMREGLKTLFISQNGFRVIGETSNGQEAVELARKLKPDLVVIETALPILNGVEAPTIQLGNRIQSALLDLLVDPWRAIQVQDRLALIPKHDPFIRRWQEAAGPVGNAATATTTRGQHDVAGQVV